VQVYSHLRRAEGPPQRAIGPQFVVKISLRNFVANDQFLNVAGAFVDLCAPNILADSLDWVFLQVAEATMELDAVGADLLLDFRCIELHHHRLDLGAHLGQSGDNSLVLIDRLAA
jgi:hypothetical protein